MILLFCLNRIRTLVSMATYSWLSLLFHCRYFDEHFLEIFVEWSSTKHIFVSNPLNLIGCDGNQKAEFAKNIQKDFYRCRICTLVAMAT